MDKEKITGEIDEQEEIEKENRRSRKFFEFLKMKSIADSTKGISGMENTPISLKNF